MFKNKREGEILDKYRNLLEEYNKENGIEGDLIVLSETQEKAIKLYKDGKNILVIGSAGCGKSLLVKEMKYHTNKEFPNKKIVITATTGIAAYNINGITINSFMGIGTGEQSIEVLVKRIMRKRGVRDRIRNTCILIIDEISMMSAEIFEKINKICQIVRNNYRFFGGIQIVLTGDFYQLLPVFNRNEKLYSEQDNRLVFESETFSKIFSKNNDNIVVLKSNFRQNDIVFKELLLRIRKGEQTKEDIKKLESRMIDKFPEINKDMVYLVSSNKKAQTINLTNLNEIVGKSMIYKSEFCETGDDEEICKELRRDLESQFSQKGITTVTLKKGARVMLIKNICVEEGLVNGSVGTIIDFHKIDGINGEKYFPLVLFDNGVQKFIENVEWELDIGNCKVTAIQIPLMLCWAITHHKSQSLTLERAILDIGDCFCDHQVYVALSRLKDMSGLYLNTFNPKKIKVNEKVKTYINKVE